MIKSYYMVSVNHFILVSFKFICPIQNKAIIKMHVINYNWEILIGMIDSETLVRDFYMLIIKSVDVHFKKINPLQY